MTTIALIHWTCPHCNTENTDEQDDEYGPFFSLTCDECGLASDTSNVNRTISKPRND